MNENKGIETAVHEALKICSGLFDPDSDGFYEITDQYRSDVNDLYNALLKFDLKYGSLA